MMMNMDKHARATSHPPQEGEGRPPERQRTRSGWGEVFSLRVHPTPLAARATLPLQGRVARGDSVRYLHLSCPLQDGCFSALRVTAEHLQIDLSAQKGPANKVGEAEIPAVVEDLQKAKAFGLAAITDLSAPFWGRDPKALRRISERAGVLVVCAAGFYWDPFPDVALSAPVGQIRDAMIAEVERGADGTDIRCGVIKVGTAVSRTSRPSGCSAPRRRPAWRPARRSSPTHRARTRRPGTSACWKTRAWTWATSSSATWGRPKTCPNLSRWRAPACSWASTR